MINEQTEEYIEKLGKPLYCRGCGRWYGFGHRRGCRAWENGE